MDKQSLPKLETEGFVTTEARKPSWRAPAGRLLRKKAGKKAQNVPLEKGEDEIDIGYKRLLIKTGVCAAVAIAILVLSSVDAPVTKDLTQTVKETVNHEFDIEEDIGRLKFVQSLDEESASVFSPLPQAAAVYPADGEVVTRFGEDGAMGIRMTTQQADILCIARGTVTSVGQIGDAGYVTLVLDTGETVAFHNIVPSVQINDIVPAGQKLGELSGQYLYIEMRQGEDYVDPLVYIKTHASRVLQQ